MHIIRKKHAYNCGTIYAVISKKIWKTSSFQLMAVLVSPGLQIFEIKTSHSFIYHMRKSIVERTIQHVKDRTESFDDYFPCRKERSCKLEHISNWFRMFIDIHNGSIIIPPLNEHSRQNEYCRYRPTLIIHYYF